MVPPLTIPGVIPGISILVIASNVASGLEKGFGLELEFLPGYCVGGTVANHI